jgi:hypothetical protein
MITKGLFGVILIFSFGMWSCTDNITESSEENGPVQSKKVPANIQSDIFSKSCALSGCHNGSVSPNLTADAAYGNIVGVPSDQKPNLNRIEPGDPGRSYLYLKITGDNSITGVRMPNGGPPLSAAEIETIRIWIENGAPEE